MFVNTICFSISFISSSLETKAFQKAFTFSKLIIVVPGTRHCSGGIIVNFGQISHVALVFLLFTLNIETRFKANSWLITLLNKDFCVVETGTQKKNWNLKKINVFRPNNMSKQCYFGSTKYWDFIFIPPRLNR